MEQGFLRLYSRSRSSTEAEGRANIRMGSIKISTQGRMKDGFEQLGGSLETLETSDEGHYGDGTRPIPDKVVLGDGLRDAFLFTVRAGRVSPQYSVGYVLSPLRSGCLYNILQAISRSPSHTKTSPSKGVRARTVFHRTLNAF